MKKFVTCLSLVALVACGGEEPSSDTPTPTTEDTGSGLAELPQIYINEFMASNTNTIADEAGAYPDWIELYNPGGAEVDLGGWWLTDDLGYKFKYQIPAGVIVPAGGYLVFFADKDPEEGDLHATFQLDALGGDVGLYGPNVYDNPEIDAVEAYGNQVADVSLGRSPDGGAVWAEMSPATPGASNGG